MNEINIKIRFDTELRWDSLIKDILEVIASKGPRYISSGVGNKRTWHHDGISIVAEANVKLSDSYYPTHRVFFKDILPFGTRLAVKDGETWRLGTILRDTPIDKDSQPIILRGDKYTSALHIGEDTFIPELPQEADISYAEYLKLSGSIYEVNKVKSRGFWDTYIKTELGDKLVDVDYASYPTAQEIVDFLNTKSQLWKQ